MLIFVGNPLITLAKNFGVTFERKFKLTNAISGIAPGSLNAPRHPSFEKDNSLSQTATFEQIKHSLVQMNPFFPADELIVF